MKLNRLLVVLIISVIFVAGCRSNPVLNVENAVIGITASNKKLTLADVRKAIINAGATRGWSFTKVDSNHLVGTLVLRRHTAIVDVTYDTKSYSIKHKDSINLDYDGTNIHSNYNSWIRKLRKSIDVQLRAY